MKITTTSATQTKKFGKDFAKKLKGGEVVLLIGDLGAGKTTFVQGVAEGLGVKQIVNSPTFVIMKLYQVPSAKFKAQSKSKVSNLNYKVGKESASLYQLPVTSPQQLVHMDTYRGMGIADLENIGALELFGKKENVCFVEWGAGLENYLRERGVRTIVVRIQVKDKNGRTFIVDGG